MTSSRFKKGCPCPVAGLAGKRECLGADCGWYLPDSDPRCLIALQTVTLMSMIDELEKLTGAVRTMGDNIGVALGLLDEFRNDSEEAGK